MKSNQNAQNETEGTNAQMSGYITEQEKLVWMYNAYLVNNSISNHYKEVLPNVTLFFKMLIFNLYFIFAQIFKHKF